MPAILYSIFYKIESIPAFAIFRLFYRNSLKSRIRVCQYLSVFARYPRFRHRFASQSSIFFFAAFLLHLPRILPLLLFPLVSGLHPDISFSGIRCLLVTRTLECRQLADPAAFQLGTDLPRLGPPPSSSRSGRPSSSTDFDAASPGYPTSSRTWALRPAVFKLLARLFGLLGPLRTKID
jgi:hypothetical protein